MVDLGEIYEKEFASIDEFIAFVDSELLNSSYDFCFRGHASSEWSLEPTVMRYIDRITKAFPQWSDRWDFVRERVYQGLDRGFRKNLIKNTDIPQSEVERMDAWQYGQHYGLPTPLLDWTYSPYIALFFALSESQPQGADTTRRCVWGLNLDCIKAINDSLETSVWPKYKDNYSDRKSLESDLPKLKIVDQLDQKNRRIVFQQGLFTKHEYHKSLEIWLGHISQFVPMKGSASPVLSKFVFPCTESQRCLALDKLEKMNITNRTLFPDIQGSVHDTVDSVFRGFNGSLTKLLTFYNPS